MRRLGLKAFLITLSMALGACGSPLTTVTDSDDNGGGTTPTATPTFVNVFASAGEMLTTADTQAEGVTVTAIVLDSNSNSIEGQVVVFSLDTGPGQIIPVQTTTDSSGIAQIVLTTAGNSTVRTITVRGTAGSATDTVAVNVVTSTAPPAPPSSVARVDVFSSAAHLFDDADTQGEGVTITAQVTNSSGYAVSGVTVGFSVSGGTAALIPVRETTDASGTAVFVLTTAGDSTARTLVVTASVPTATVQDDDTVSVVVVGHATEVIGTLSSTQLPNDDTAPVLVVGRAEDAQSAPVANVPIAFSVSSGAISGGTDCPVVSARCTVMTTDSTGVTGTATITTGGVATPRTITVTMSAPGATADSAGISVVAAVATVELTPATGSIFTDADTAGEGLTLSAIARDSTGNGLAGQPITFSVSCTLPAPCGRNGLLQQSSGTTDSSGRASVVLTVGSAADSDVLTVTATYDRATGADPTDSSAISVVGRVDTVEVVSSAPQIATSADTLAEGVTITAIVRDGNNNLVTGVPVSFSTDHGAITAGGTTDSSGTASATLTTGGDPTNQIITVTANSLGETDTVAITELGTTLTVTGADGVGSQQVETYTVTLVDAAGAPLSARTVMLSVVDGNTLSAPSVITGSNGTATFTLTGNSPTGGTETITATSLGATGTKTLTVSEYDMSFTVPATTPTEVDFGTPQTLTVVLQQNGAPLAGETILFSATRGTLTANSAVTNASGEATVSISSSGAGGAGLSLVTATGPTSLPIAQRISVTTEIEFIAVSAASIEVRAEPTTVAATTSTTTGTSTITAVVRDENNNPVKNKQVDFTVASSVGGGVAPGTVITNSFGEAVTTFTAGTQASANNGITIRATEFSTSITDTVDNTVGGTALFIRLGTGNVIAETADETSYQMPWTAVVTDSAGNPAPAGTNFRLKVLSVEYQKGVWAGCDLDGDGVADRWCASYSVTPTGAAGFGCLNEDRNENGILDLDEDLDGDGVLDTDEDIDNDGNFDQGEDLDHDGEIGGLDEDVDGDGSLSTANEDVNGDGNLDVDEQATAGGDGDLVLDTADEDLDQDPVTAGVQGDGALDVDEDVDNDGNLDVVETDTDGDGFADNGDEDPDNDGDCSDGDPTPPDGVCDPNEADEDVDNDGTLDATNEDLDGDGFLDEQDEDVDGDGWLDVDEDADNDGVLDTNNEDTDGDGTLDVDEDVDNDGVLDFNEDLDGDGLLDTDEDLNNDGGFDDIDEDVDNDGVRDTGDEDTNNDGDCVDAGEFVGPDNVCNTSDVNESDTDGDGQFDDGGGIEDIDGDGHFDDRDEDVDGDGNFDNANEDADSDGVLDAAEDADGDGKLDSGEDVNHNGVLDESVDVDQNRNGTLEPGNVTVVPTFEALVSGRTSFKIEYPQSYGAWVKVRLQAIATVSGTESTSQVLFVLPVLDDDVDSIEDDSPPGTIGDSGFVESPYGIGSSCSNPD